MSFEEFTGFVEETSTALHRTYEELLEASPEDAVANWPREHAEE